MSLRNEDLESGRLLPISAEETESQSKFWLYAEFGKNFAKTLFSTAISNATLITYMADLPNWKFGVGLIAAEISCPLALLFALCEAYSHLQQSNSFAASEENVTTIAGRSIPLSEVPLTKKQLVAAIIHYVSDVLEDAMTPLVITQLLASEASLPALQSELSPRWVKCMIGTGALLFSALGNRRELSNTLTAAKENNLREMLVPRAPGV